MPLLYHAVKRLAGVSRYALALEPVTRLQRLLLYTSPSFQRRWSKRGSGASSRISPRDEMYLGDLRHYYDVGMSGLECIEKAMNAAGLASPRNVLDLPSGHGRVLRFVAERFPQARLTACDLDGSAVSFCAATFGSRAVVSRADVEALVLDEQFDLIWCGSLLTHLDAQAIESLLRFFKRHLVPGGLLVFSVHGDRAANMLRRRELLSYGLAKRAADEVLRAYERSGFAYADYRSEQQGYGVTFTTSAWIRATLAKVDGLKEVYCEHGAWAGHQDVYGVVLA